MLFNSIHFLIFFPIVVLIYFSLPYRFRWILLLASSYYFYMSWKAEYVILIMISTIIDYFSAIQIDKHESKTKRKMFLSLSLFTNLGLLFAFKYFNFFNEQTRLLLEQFSISHSIPLFNVLLPVGISFYTFQTLSYTIDVYRKKIKPTKHLGIFAVYVAFFPQLVAGPIERASHLLPQFLKKHNFNYRRTVDGLKIILWGFFLKVVIADRLAIVVDQVYNNVINYTGFPLVIATYFFSFQIYCDFAGYSFIAIGTAKILGIDIIQNFRRPFFSKSLPEFWRRWHISLSTWFQDYAFTPFYLKVKKNKYLSKLSTKMNHNISFFIATIITISLLGMWHGAGWKFLLFGLYHALLIPVFYFARTYWEKLPSLLQIFITFNIVTFSFIIFRANSIHDLVYIVTHIFTDMGYVILNFYKLGMGQGILGGAFLGLDKPELIIAVVSILFMESVHLIQEKTSITRSIRTKPTLLRWLGYLLIILVILLFGVFGGKQFIYFQF